MAEAFELYASFKIDTSGYTQELNKIRQEMQRFQQELNNLAIHPTFDGGRFRTELQQAQQQSTQATQEIQRLQQQIQSLQQTASGGGSGGSGDSGGGVLSGFLGRLDIIGEIASGQFLANMAVNAINSIIGGITGAISESIDLASDLVETQNVVDVTFGDSAETINRWSKEALNAYGITETKAKQYSSTLGAMLKSMGIADDQVLQMSMDMAGLAADMASFYNLDHDTAFEKIRSGISGETEPLKSLGLNLSVANLNAFALEKGMTKTFDKMSQAEQATLRYQYLLEATKDAQGDFARTGDSYSNEMRKLQTNLDRIKTEFGKGLLGVVTPAISLLNNVLSDKSYQYTTAEKIIAERNESLYEAQASYQGSLTIINAMRNMESESGEAVKSTKEWKNALEDLKNVMPGLAQYVDLTSDAIIGNSEAINKYVESVKGVSLYNSYEQAVQDAKKERDKIASEIAANEAELEYVRSVISGQNSAEVENAAREARQTAYERFKYLAEIVAPEYNFPDTFGAFKQTIGYQGVLAAYNTAGALFSNNPELTSAYEALHKAEAAYENPVADYQEREKELVAENARLTESLRELDNTVASTTSQWEAYKKAHPEAEEQSKFDSAVAAEKKAIEDLKNALKDLETYRKDTLEKAQKAYKGVASGAGYMVKHTQAELKKLLDTDYSKENVLSWYGKNADALNAYNDALKQAQAAGVDVGILEGLTKYSKENDAYLSRLLNLTPEEIEQLNADYQRSREAEKAMAETSTELTLATDETYQAMREKVEELAKIYNQSDSIAAAMAENRGAFLAGIDLLKETLEAELPGINEILERYGFATLKSDVAGNPGVHDFFFGDADLRDADIAQARTSPTLKEQAQARRAREQARARSGYADMIEEGLMPDDIKARAQRWNRFVDAKQQEARDIADILEQRIAEKQKQQQEEASAKSWNDMTDIISSDEFKNAESYTPANNGKINILSMPQSNTQGNQLVPFEDYRSRAAVESSQIMQSVMEDAVEAFTKQMQSTQTSTQEVAIANPQDLATYLQQPVTIVNNFSVDGKSVATAVTPIVNKTIGRGIRENLMEVAR